ncbi:MAG: TetR/AcrR family transcriptional regulator [Acidobacteria bacterium]|nr:TetR/AcrR family transcriptional regulator [Acidobacteriota bacterium]
MVRNSAGNNSSAPQDSKYDRKLHEILHHATQVFCEKGFAAASIRDISRASGTSLAGLYYYFKSKDHLLFIIQQQAFTTLIQRLETRLSTVAEPEEAIRAFIENHMEHFVGDPKQAQVLSHESDTLKGQYQLEITSLKRKYYRQCLTIVEQLKAARQLSRLNSRLAVLSLFGMMNWIYTWYNPIVDGDWKEISSQMSSIYLNGVLGGFESELTAAPSKKTNTAEPRARTSGNAAPHHGKPGRIGDPSGVRS